MTNMPSPKTDFHLPDDSATFFKNCASSVVSEEAIEEMKETRPTFKELKSIERLRREILFRVSINLHLSTSFKSFLILDLIIISYTHVLIDSNGRLLRANFLFGGSFFSGVEHA